MVYRNQVVTISVQMLVPQCDVSVCLHSNTHPLRIYTLMHMQSIHVYIIIYIYSSLFAVLFLYSL